MAVFRLFQSGNIVRLETTNKSMIAQITKLLIYENEFYILDVRSKSIFKFSQEGKFLGKIRNLGKGPKEYTSISSFDIANDTIYALVQSGGNKLFKYNLNLDLVSSNNFQVSGCALKKFNEKFVLFCDNQTNKGNVSLEDNYNIIGLSMNNKVKWKDLKFDNSYSNRSVTYGHWGDKEFTTNSLNKVYFTHTFSNIIYKLKEIGIQPHIQVLDEYNLMREPQSFFNRTELIKYFKEDALKNIYDVYINDKFMTCSIYKGSVQRCIKDKNKLLCAKSGPDSKYILNLDNISAINSQENTLITNVPSIHVNCMCKKKPSEMKELYGDDIFNVKEYDNPILIYLKYEKN